MTTHKKVFRSAAQTLRHRFSESACRSYSWALQIVGYKMLHRLFSTKFQTYRSYSDVQLDPKLCHFHTWPVSDVMWKSIFMFWWRFVLTFNRGIKDYWNNNCIRKFCNPKSDTYDLVLVTQNSTLKDHKLWWYRLKIKKKTLISLVESRLLPLLNISIQGTALFVKAFWRFPTFEFDRDFKKARSWKPHKLCD